MACLHHILSCSDPACGQCWCLNIFSMHCTLHAPIAFPHSRVQAKLRSSKEAVAALETALEVWVYCGRQYFLAG